MNSTCVLFNYNYNGCDFALLWLLCFVRYFYCIFSLQLTLLQRDVIEVMTFSGKIHKNRWLWALCVYLRYRTSISQNYELSINNKISRLKKKVQGESICPRLILITVRTINCLSTLVTMWRWFTYNLFYFFFIRSFASTGF